MRKKRASVASPRRNADEDGMVVAEVKVSQLNLLRSTTNNGPQLRSSIP
jgi:hypothetical protein